MRTAHRSMPSVDHDTTRTTIAAGIVHDLKLPLQVVLGWASLLKRDEHDGAQLDHALTVVERNTRLQMALVDHLLEVLLPTWHSSGLRGQPLDFRALVENEVRAVQPLAREKGIRVSCSAPSSDFTIEGIDVHLRRVVANLVGNALKFTSAPVTIDCRLWRSSASVGLDVCDSGLGIDRVFLPSVFEAFRLAPGKGGRDSNGQGLGLSVVRHLVELHGGTVTANSDGRGCGSTFTVTLPAATPEGMPARARYLDPLPGTP